MSVTNIIFIVFIVICCLVLFAFLLPRFMKLKSSISKMKESKKIKNELAIWKRIAHLARGGKDSDDIKKKMSKDELEIIRTSFELCKEKLKDNFKGLYDNPWFMILGEPSSGKSTLIASSSQDMVSTQDDEVGKNGSRKPPFIKFWLNNNAVVADVSGRVFFDTWFDGSSSQWYGIINTLKKKHKKEPLSALIITIPADSLFVDDENLSRKKANIIKNETNRLLNGLGMSLPCYVLVTKMDIISGFREYFSNVSDEIKSTELGYKSKNHFYDEMEFSNFWQDFIHKLRLGRNGLLLRHDITKDEFNRLDEASKIYMFAENVNELSTNLEIYFEIIFSDKKSSLNSSLLFEGLYFTSAKDGGYSLNKHFAKLHNKSIDEAPVSEELMQRQGFFIDRLFKYQIFKDLKLATFTPKELLRRNIPHFISLFIVVFFSLSWLGAILFNQDSIKDSIGNNPHYYRELADLFSLKDIDNSVLIGLGHEADGVYYGAEVMPHDSLLSREGFYLSSLRDSEAKWTAPFGFKFASFLKFNSSNIAWEKRSFLFNSVYKKMVLIPLVETLEKHFTMNALEPFSLKKREALKALLNLSSAKSCEQFKEAGAMLAFILPELNKDILLYMSPSNMHFCFDDEKFTESLILSSSYINGVRAGVNSMINAWLDGSIYPDSFYKQVTTLIYSSLELNNLINELNSMDISNFSKNNLQSNADYFTSIYERENLHSNLLKQSINFIDLKLENTEFISKNANIGGRFNFLFLASISYEDFMKLHKEDFDFLRSYAKNYSRGTEYSISNIYLEESNRNSLMVVDENYSSLQTFNVGVIAPIFENTEPDEQKAKTPLYVVVSELFELAYNPAITIVDVNDNLLLLLENYQEKVVKNLDKLKEYEKKYENDKMLSALISRLKIMHSQTAQYSEAKWAETMLSSYPKTTIEMMDLVAKEDDNISIFNKSIYFDLNYKKEYSPRVAQKYIKTFWEITHKIFKDDLSLDFSNALGDFKSIYDVMNSYSVAFIRYWASYADSLSPSFKDYNEFYTFISKAKANDINAELYNIYSNTYKILQETKSNSLPRQLLVESENALRSLEEKMAKLSPSFSELCDSFIKAWLSLSSSAIEANKIFSIIGTKDFALKYAGIGNNIPWWYKLFKSGENLMRKDSWIHGMQDAKSLQDKFKNFPIYKNGDANASLSPSELISLRDTLLNIVGDSDENQSIKAPSSVNLVFKNEKQISNWAKNALSIINSISLNAVPLEYKLFILDNETQVKLAKSTAYNAALAKFRFIDLNITDINFKSPRLSTSAASKTTQILHSGNSFLGSFIFNFYEYSNSLEAQSFVRIDGKYSVLSMYLDDMLIKDENNDRVFYVALKVKDDINNEYIYYLGLEFNRKILDKDKWPNQYNWPSFY